MYLLSIFVCFNDSFKFINIIYTLLTIFCKISHGKLIGVKFGRDYIKSGKTYRNRQKSIQ